MTIEDKIFDAVVIGGGPAGVSCAVWLARLGYAPALLEAGAEIGGLCRYHSFLDEWNASLPGMTGPQVADNLLLSLEQAKVPFWLSNAASDVYREGEGFVVQTQGVPRRLQAKHVVLATGVRARGLDDALEEELTLSERAKARKVRQDKGGMPSSYGILTGPGRHIVEQNFQGKRVAVLGGGDNAFENALYAMDHGASVVDVYVRTVRAQRQFTHRVPKERIIQGGYRVDADTRTVNGQRYDLILVFYGWDPCVQFADKLGLQRSTRGFVATETHTAQTSSPGVYAIGEVTQRQHPCVVTALADGVTAAKAIQARLETEWPRLDEADLI
ncbi:NAD(P)/FAD-dependent oxidoreductase [Alcaligenaceae bacterium]|nr:NAD(P)/FAD-dependent oxidoreductase [Alcaligenaceae bacterium]